jgi:GGDEF domain-containing protein
MPATARQDLAGKADADAKALALDTRDDGGSDVAAARAGDKAAEPPTPPTVSPGGLDLTNGLIMEGKLADVERLLAQGKADAALLSKPAYKRSLAEWDSVTEARARLQTAVGMAAIDFDSFADPAREKAGASKDKASVAFVAAYKKLKAEKDALEKSAASLDLDEKSRLEEGARMGSAEEALRWAIVELPVSGELKKGSKQMLFESLDFRYLEAQAEKAQSLLAGLSSGDPALAALAKRYDALRGDRDKPGYEDRLAEWVHDADAALAKSRSGKLGEESDLRVAYAGTLVGAQRAAQALQKDPAVQALLKAHPDAAALLDKDPKDLSAKDAAGLKELHEALLGVPVYRDYLKAREATLRSGEALDAVQSSLPDLAAYRKAAADRSELVRGLLAKGFVPDGAKFTARELALPDAPPDSKVVKDSEAGHEGLWVQPPGKSRAFRSFDGRIEADSIPVKGGEILRWKYFDDQGRETSETLMGKGPEGAFVEKDKIDPRTHLRLESTVKGANGVMVTDFDPKTGKPTYTERRDAHGKILVETRYSADGGWITQDIEKGDTIKVDGKVDKDGNRAATQIHLAIETRGRLSKDDVFTPESSVITGTNNRPRFDKNGAVVEISLDVDPESDAGGLDWSKLQRPGLLSAEEVSVFKDLDPDLRGLSQMDIRQKKAAPGKTRDLEVRHLYTESGKPKLVKQSNGTWALTYTTDEVMGDTYSLVREGDRWVEIHAGGTGSLWNTVTSYTGMRTDGHFQAKEEFSDTLVDTKYNGEVRSTERGVIHKKYSYNAATKEYDLTLNDVPETKELSKWDMLARGLSGSMGGSGVFDNLGRITSWVGDRGTDVYYGVSSAAETVVRPSPYTVEDGELVYDPHAQTTSIIYGIVTKYQMPMFGGLDQSRQASIMMDKLRDALPKGEFDRARSEWIKEYKTARMKSAQGAFEANDVRFTEPSDEELGEFLISGEGMGGLKGVGAHFAHHAAETGSAGWEVLAIGTYAGEFTAQSLGFEGVGTVTKGLGRVSEAANAGRAVRVASTVAKSWEGVQGAYFKVMLGVQGVEMAGAIASGDKYKLADSLAQAGGLLVMPGGDHTREAKGLEKTTFRGLAREVLTSGMGYNFAKGAGGVGRDALLSLADRFGGEPSAEPVVDAHVNHGEDAVPVSEEQIIHSEDAASADLHRKYEDKLAEAQRQAAADPSKKGEVAKARQELDGVGKVLDTDLMTGTKNRGALEQVAPGEIEKIRAAGGEPMVAIGDLNGFGPTNDGLAAVEGSGSKGAALGDAALGKAGVRLNGLAREYGVTIGRYGGEEFVVVGDKPGVMKFLEAAREEFKGGQLFKDAGFSDAHLEAIKKAAAARGRAGEPIGDFTFGVTEVSADGTFGDAVKKADAGLLWAKTNGQRGKAVVNDGAGGFTVAPDVMGLRERISNEAGKLIRDFQVKQAEKSIPERIDALRQSMDPKDFEEFMQVAFRDPLTGLRTRDYLTARAGEWSAKYGNGGEAVMLSPRGLKPVNDALGHAAGDRFLERYGQIVADVAAEKAKAGAHVEDPVRLGGKDVILIGDGSPEVAAEAQKRFAAEVNDGKLFRAGDIAKIEQWGTDEVGRRNESWQKDHEGRKPSAQEADRIRRDVAYEVEAVRNGSMLVVEGDIAAKDGRADVGGTVDALNGKMDGSKSRAKEEIGEDESGGGKSGGEVQAESRYAAKPDVLSRFGGADPLKAEGIRIGGAGGGGARLIEINGEKWVIKTRRSVDAGTQEAYRAKNQNEMLGRELVRRFFPEFGTPEGLSYEDGNVFVTMSRYSEGKNSSLKPWADMTAEQRASLSILAEVFGLSDINHGNILFGGDRPELIDFESIGRDQPHDSAQIARIMIKKGWAPFVDRGAYNDPAAYEAQIARWKERFQDPEFQKKLDEGLGAAGIKGKEAETYKKNLGINLTNYEKNIRAYLDIVNEKNPKPESAAAGEPADTQPAQPEPADTQPAKPELANTQPAKPELANTQPALAAPENTQPAAASPAKGPPAVPQYLKDRYEAASDLNAKAGQGELYRSNSGKTLVKVFKLGEKSTAREAVDALIAHNDELHQKGVRTVPMKAVEVSPGKWGVEMPFIEGQSMADFVDRDWNDDTGHSELGMRRIKQAQDILRKIDEVTAKDPAHPGKDNLTDHRGRVVLDDGTFLHDNEDYANFIIDKNGDVINIDPLNMDSVMKRGPPADAPAVKTRPEGETASQKVADVVDRAIGAVKKMISGEEAKPLDSPEKQGPRSAEPDRGRAPPAEEAGAPEPPKAADVLSGQKGRYEEFEKVYMTDPADVDLKALPEGIPPRLNPSFKAIHDLFGDRYRAFRLMQAFEREVVARSKAEGESLDAAREGVLADWEARHGFKPVIELQDRVYEPHEWQAMLREGATFRDPTLSASGGSRHGAETHRLQWHLVMRAMEADPAAFGKVGKASEIYKSLGEIDNSKLDWTETGVEGKGKEKDLWFQLFDNFEQNWSSPEFLRPQHAYWPGLGHWY